MSITVRPALHTLSFPCVMVLAVLSFSFWFSSVIFHFWLNYLNLSIKCFQVKKRGGGGSNILREKNNVARYYIEYNPIFVKSNILLHRKTSGELTMIISA